MGTYNLIGFEAIRTPEKGGGGAGEIGYLIQMASYPIWYTTLTDATQPNRSAAGRALYYFHIQVLRGTNQADQSPSILIH